MRMQPIDPLAPPSGPCLMRVAGQPVAPIPPEQPWGMTWWVLDSSPDVLMPLTLFRLGLMDAVLGG